MADDQMRYDVMTREALRTVVRQALHRAAAEGLPGAHHFYITFRTHGDGVDIDPQLMERYPYEMTIVLEHQYWDLEVDDEGFEVTLKFNRIPKYLRVPFSAVSQFHDPSVGFTLRFDTADGAAPAASEGNGESAALAKPAPSAVEGEKIVSLDAFRNKQD